MFNLKEATLSALVPISDQKTHFGFKDTSRVRLVPPWAHSEANVQALKRILFMVLDSLLS